MGHKRDIKEIKNKDHTLNGVLRTPPKFAKTYIIYIIGSQTGVRVPPEVRKVVQGVRGEKISAITENGRNSQNVPFETEIILCIKIAQIPLYFVLQGCISFL